MCVDQLLEFSVFTSFQKYIESFLSLILFFWGGGSVGGYFVTAPEMKSYIKKSTLKDTTGLGMQAEEMEWWELE